MRENTGKPYSTITNQHQLKEQEHKGRLNDTYIVRTAVGELGQSDTEQ